MTLSWGSPTFKAPGSSMQYNVEVYKEKCDEKCVATVMEKMGLFEDSSAIPLHIICHRLDKAGRDGLRLWIQVIWNIGATIESALLQASSLAEADEMTQDSSPEPSFLDTNELLMPRTAHTRAVRQMKFMQNMKVESWVTEDTTTGLLQAFFAIRKMMKDVSTWS